MKFKDVYKECNNKKYCKITEINEPLKLHSNFKNYITNHKTTLIIFLVVLLILVFITFKFNIQIILATIGLLLLFLIMLVINNTYSIIGKDGKLIVNADLNIREIDYQDLINIYLSEKKNKILFFIPYNFYNISIIFKDKENFVEASYSTIMLDKNEILNFFDSIKYQVLEAQSDEEKRKKEANSARKIIMLLILIVLVSLFITGFIVYLINNKNF